MSNGILYDSLLVRHLADELNDRLSGRRICRVGLEPDERRAVIEFDDAALTWELHPVRGSITLGPPAATTTHVAVHRRARMDGVHVPEDERVLFLEIESPGRSVRQARRVVFELMTNQWNALVLNRKDEILGVLRPRRAGKRILRREHAYAPPPPTQRIQQPDRTRWHQLLDNIPPGERAGVLNRRVAYASTVNGTSILGEAADRSLDAAYDRYRELVAKTTSSPCVLLLRGRPQPYPFPLPGVELRETMPTLLDAIAEATGAAAREAVTRPSVPLELLERLRERLARTEAKRSQLARELDGSAPEAAALRHRANLLLSQLGKLRKGMAQANLPDLEGGTVTIDLDPALTPVENADRLYDAAQKRERAAERLPELIRAARAEGEQLSRLLARAEAGEADAAAVEERIGKAEPEEREAGPERLPPYRRYLTSGGLEVRVGRNRRANDELTFHHSSPEDIWLHAREVAGSHVVLRWGRKGGNPPQSDLLQAAVLAALNSKARSSGTVAVDWTRRKYVRKPRKSPPGAVLPDRVQTLFVEPDARLEKRLRSAE